MKKSLTRLWGGLLACALLLGLPFGAYASTTNLDLTAQFGTALSPTTNPDPNTLTVKSPYPTPYIAPQVVSAAWTAQARPALFPLGKTDIAGQVPLKLHFVPSAGATVTYTVTIWMYDRLSNTWAKPANNPSNTYTGEAIDCIYQPGNDAIFVQISNISNGTLSIFYDASAATGL